MIGPEGQIRPACPVASMTKAKRKAVGIEKDPYVDFDELSTENSEAEKNEKSANRNR